MADDPPKKKRGRPPGIPNKRVAFRPDTRVRAHQIFRESGCAVKMPHLSRQLVTEGFQAVDPQVLARWRRDEKWDDTAVKTPIGVPESEELRRAIAVRVPDDLNQVEQASNRLAAVAENLAAHVVSQIPNIKIESVADLEVASRCLDLMLRCHLNVGKGLQDLRLLRVSSNFGPEPNGAKNGEILPPEPKQDDHFSEQERVLSNFAGP